jgi:hypothetical protein
MLAAATQQLKCHEQFPNSEQQQAGLQSGTQLGSYCFGDFQQAGRG